ncbi:MAG: HEAT repeat domain-containing protein [Phycisphaerales bacterium]
MSVHTPSGYAALACMALAICCHVQTGQAQTVGPLVPADGGIIDLPMLRDPTLPDREAVVDFDPGYKQLWIAALNRPEYDLRMNALLAFTDARLRGVAGLDDVAPLFVDKLADDPNRFVRLAAARALVAFDYDDAAAALLSASEDPNNVGLDMIAVVDPALADWDFAPARTVWLSRITGKEEATARASSAIQCLGQVRADEAVDTLLGVVRDASRPATLRLTAAQALGNMTDTRIESAVGDLIAGNRPIDRMLAVRMLASDPADEAHAHLVELAHDQPVVAAQALRNLNRLSPGTVASTLPDLRSSGDPNVRIEVVRSLAGTAASASVEGLIASLNDPDPGIRYLSRDALIQFGASESLGREVREACMGVLDGGDWRSLEQAVLIAGALHMEQSADRLIELLEHDRPETRLAAANALRELNLESTLPAIFERVQALTGLALESRGRPAEFQDFSAETTQLVMALAELRYEPAAELLVRYIPKHSGFDGMARGAALYALGRIYEDRLRADLSTLFQERLADDTPIDPESAYVRRFAAIALGRMKAADGLDTLRAFYSADVQITSIAGASRWAIMQIEGGELPPLAPMVTRPHGYFLEPAVSSAGFYQTTH